jgi:hypothetical protein
MKRKTPFGEYPSGDVYGGGAQIDQEECICPAMGLLPCAKIPIKKN